jgi:hypothetical protein
VPEMWLEVLALPSWEVLELLEALRELEVL